MSALAKILLEKGYEVSGSDLHGSPIVEHLQAMGAKIFQGHRAEHVQGVDAIVVSSAIHEDNPEVTAAKAQGIQRLHRSDVNAALLNAVKGIAVAGAHGKTTTTSMIGVTLDHAGLQPTIIIGGEVDYLDGNARLGKGGRMRPAASASSTPGCRAAPAMTFITPASVAMALT